MQTVGTGQKLKSKNDYLQAIEPECGQCLKKKNNLLNGLFTCFYHQGVKSPEPAGECASPAGW